MMTETRVAENTQRDIIQIGAAGVAFTPAEVADFPGYFESPFSDFKSPEDIGFTSERIAGLRNLARPRESEV